VHETTTFLLVTWPNVHRFKKNTGRRSNKPFFIWLLTIPPHLKYVTTVPCNISLVALFSDISVSQISVVTYARSGGIFNNVFNFFYCKLTSESDIEKILKIG